MWSQGRRLPCHMAGKGFHTLRQACLPRRLLTHLTARLDNDGNSGHRAVCVRNETRIALPTSKAAFLEGFLRCPYITARTVNTTNVLEFEAHVLRLTYSARMILARPGDCDDDIFVKPSTSTILATPLTPMADSCVETVTNRNRFYPFAFRSVRAGLKEFARAFPGSEEERRITTVLNFDFEDPSSFDVYTLVEEMPQLGAGPIVVQIRAQPPEHAYHMAGAKDTQWVRDRRTLETLQGNAHEVLLASPEGDILEGLQTNFFAVLKDQVHTAVRPDVLPGTIRKIVMRICAEQDIPIREYGPSAHDVRSFLGSFITSTSRLLLPIDTIEVFEDALDPMVQGTPRMVLRQHMPHCPLVAQIMHLLADEMLAAATPIIDVEDELDVVC